MSMDTSIAALDSTPRARLRARVLELLKEYSFGNGLTADECARLLREDRLSIRPRFTELKVAGLVYDTGLRRPNASGKNAAVWCAA